MKLIGIEEHFLTAEIRQAWEAIGLDAVDPSVAFHSGAIESRLLNLAEDRLALMDETGLDVQVLSLTTPMLHDLGPQSVDMARRTNDALAAAVARHPARFHRSVDFSLPKPEEAMAVPVGPRHRLGDLGQAAESLAIPGEALLQDHDPLELAPPFTNQQRAGLQCDALPSLWGALVEGDPGAIVLLGAKVPPDRFVEIAESVRLELIGEHPH